VDDWKLQPARDLDQAGMARYRNPRREHGLVSSGLRLLWWAGVRLLLGVRNRLEVHGRRRLPQTGPVVLVANHASHLDALVIGCALPLGLRDRLFPLAAGDVFFETPAVAAFAAHVLNALPVWRRNAGRHGLKELRARLLEEAAVYILFPEGGRSRDGSMKPFKHGIGMLVAGTDVPVVPCHLAGTLQAFPPGTRWPRPHKVVLHVGRARTFAEVANDRDGWQLIARELEQDVYRLGTS
jgi:1-acyl-sn-glycerol-3-phosphate acyltransferase